MAQTYTDADFRDSTIRSSKLKSWEGCSYLYWASYVEGVPQVRNSGAEKGSICHDLLEMLGYSKNKPIYDKIIASGSIYSHKPIERLVRIYISKSDTLKPDQTTLSHINDMMMVGLSTDFFVEGGTIIAHEYMFEMTNEKPYYKIKGFFDKAAIKGDHLLIYDYKSSKLQYSGSDKESNTQALIYSLAARKLWPNKKPIVRFVFLQYPKNPIMEVEFNNEVLDGYEKYLSLMQEKFDNFVYKDASSNYAAEKEPPSDGGFGGKLLCGYAKKPDQLKKDGTKMFHCPYKFGFDYYIVKQDGKPISSCFENKAKRISPKEGQTIEKVKFAGCPKFCQSNTFDHMFGPRKEIPKSDDGIGDF